MPYAQNVEPDHDLNRKILLTGIGIFVTGVLVLSMLSASGVGFPAVIAILVIVFLLFWFSADIAMFGMGATEVSPAEAPALHAIVDKLIFFADMPKPRIAIADTACMNAFAAGRSPSASVVCVTSGLQNELTEDELMAVLSHEIAHVAHRDVAMMTLASIVTLLAGMLTRATFWNATTPSGVGGRKRGPGSNFAVALTLYTTSVLLGLALSRYREFVADRTGSIITGKPEFLITALQKVEAASRGTSKTSPAMTHETFNTFFIIPALGNREGQSLAAIFSTHPPTSERIDRLRSLQQQLGSSSTSV